MQIITNEDFKCYETSHESWNKEGKNIFLDGKRLVDVKEVCDEIRELARLHSTEVPAVYCDGTETTDRIISLEELGRILAEIEFAEIDQEEDKDL